jgi:hypothetical protein
MENNQTYINDFKNIKSVDSNFSINDSMDENSSYLKITQKNGEIEMIINEPYVDYNDDANNYDSDNGDNGDNSNHINNENNCGNDSDDNLSEFIAYRDNEFESDNDDLEHSLDFKFDFDIIFTPEKNSKLLQITEIKSKIVNRIKLHALDLSHIKTLDDNEKFDLIKLFNHMV